MMRQRIRSGKSATDISLIVVLLILSSAKRFTPMGWVKSNAARGNGVNLGIELSPCWDLIIAQACHILQKPSMHSQGGNFVYYSCNTALDAGMKIQFGPFRLAP